MFKEEERQINVQIQIENSTSLHVLECMLHAHLINIALPGTFNMEVIRVLKADGFQELNFSDNPPSGEILKVTEAYF